MILLIESVSTIFIEQCQKNAKNVSWPVYILGFLWQITRNGHGMCSTRGQSLTTLNFVLSSKSNFTAILRDIFKMVGISSCFIIWFFIYYSLTVRALSNSRPIFNTLLLQPDIYYFDLRDYLVQFLSLITGKTNSIPCMVKWWKLCHSSSFGDYYIFKDSGWDSICLIAISAAMEYINY